MKRVRRRALVGVAASAGALVAGALTASAAPQRFDGHDAARTLLVGTFHGHRGRYRTIQAAVNAAKPPGPILIGPGVYHTEDDLAHPPTAKQAALGDFGGVLVRTRTLTIRGMNRSGVVLTGTKPATPACDAAPTAQELGPVDPQGGHYGNNGIVVFRAATVRIENLTVCNYLTGKYLRK